VILIHEDGEWDQRPWKRRSLSELEFLTSMEERSKGMLYGCILSCFRVNAPVAAKPVVATPAPIIVELVAPEPAVELKRPAEDDEMSEEKKAKKAKKDKKAKKHEEGGEEEVKVKKAKKSKKQDVDE
jgi:hypothetical protein